MSFFASSVRPINVCAPIHGTINYAYRHSEINTQTERERHTHTLSLTRSHTNRERERERETEQTQKYRGRVTWHHRGTKRDKTEALFTSAENNIRTNIKGRKKRFTLPFDQNKTWCFLYKRNKTLKNLWLSSLTPGITPPPPLTISCWTFQELIRKPTSSIFEANSKGARRIVEFPNLYTYTIRQFGINCFLSLVSKMQFI